MILSIKHIMLMRFSLFTTASAMLLLLLPLGQTDALQQQRPLNPLTTQRQISFHRPISYLRSAAVVEETDLTEAEETQIAYDWDEQFQQLLSFKAKYGHCNFPQNASAELTKAYPTLARFCHDHRLEYPRMRRNRLKNHDHRMTLKTFDRQVRFSRLDEVGFAFSLNGAAWYEKYQELADYKKLHGHLLVRFQEERPLYDWMIHQRHNRQNLTETRTDLLNRLDFPWENTGKVDWMDMYNQLVDFHKKHGHLRVKRESNVSLHCWIYNQRYRQNGDGSTGTPLTVDQIRLLDEIDFTWEPNLYDSLWYGKYNELVDFKNKHGHCQMQNDDPLCRWIRLQRRRRAGNRNTAPLSNEQIRLLDDIEFPWEPEFLDAKWRDNYQKLAQFRKKNGHSQPRCSTHTHLYHWSQDQRKKHEKGLLPTEQVQLLDKIDFPWQSNRKDWTKMYKELVEYSNEHGHLQVNRDDSPSLYDWMTVQRQRYHGTSKPSLSDVRIEKLEEVHFCWSLDWRERVWHEKYTEAVEFYKQHGHVRVSKKDNLALYNWIQMQGKRYKGTKGQKPLSAEELELLEQIDFSFLQKRPRVAWNAMYGEVERYRKEKGGRFPTSHKDDPELNRWVRQQRKRMRCEYGHVPLLDEQKSLLESIDFPMESKEPSRRKWNERYDKLAGFWKEHGHFLVKRRENLSLHLWVTRQREIYKRSSGREELLSKSRIYLLNRIGFPWTSDRLDKEWQMRYDELVQFLEEHGHFPESLSGHPKLYKWVERQRARYKGIGASGIPEHQIEQLEKIGFRWYIRD